MGHTTNIFVFALLFIQCINAKSALKEESIYSYKGKVVAKNVASDNVTAIWTISGKLHVQDITGHVTFKLDDVKTKIFNGDPHLLDTVESKEIPEASKIILEPFVMHDKTGFTINHHPEEPIWSLNMKRSIANIFNLNTEMKNSIINETTIFGDCNVKYKVSNDNGKIISRTIDRNSCENDPDYIVTNVELHASYLKHQPVKQETKRIYHLDETDRITKIETFSLTTYQSMPAVRSKQFFEQTQEFIRLSSEKTFEAIDISKATNTSSIIVDLSEDIEGGRSPKYENKSGDDLIEIFNQNYDEFKVYFEKCPLENLNLHTTNDTIYYMTHVLEYMDKETVKKLGKNILKKDDYLKQHIFISLLPYVGTMDVLNYIEELIGEDQELNDLLMIKILATLPIYIKDLDETKVEGMEGLLSLDNVQNNQVKIAAMLSFASIVANAKTAGQISQEKLLEYMNHYYNHYQNATTYEMKMNYLLGMINMGNSIHDENIFEIILDSNESRHLRVLAITGFKSTLDTEPEEIYQKIWPVVKNKTEPFEVRVACLDLLLYSSISPDHFKNLVNWYHDELSDPSEQHLANYFYTSLQSLKNTTEYHTNIGEMAADALEKIKPLRYNRAWSTGNYRIGYRDVDDNYGASFQARLVSNPITNVLNSAFLTVDNFALSLKLGSYSAYIKLEGVADLLFQFFFISDDYDDAIPRLMKLIQDNAYQIKNAGDDVHIDLVVFSESRVVFSMHVSKDNIDTYKENALFTDLIKLTVDYNSLSFPVYHYTSVVSDLGTGIRISTDVVDVASYEVDIFDKLFGGSASSSSEEVISILEYNMNYRSLWGYSLYSESYNPLVDASAITFKVINEEKRIYLPHVFNSTDMSLRWKHEKDGFNTILDHLIGTMVDEREVLHEYCSECEQVAEIPVGEWKRDNTIPASFEEVFGVTFNITEAQNSDEQLALDRIEPIRSGALSDIADKHVATTFDSYAKPVLYLWHYNTYKRFATSDLLRRSIRTNPYFDEPIETLIDLDFDSNDLNNDKDPITNTESDIWISLETRKVQDEEQIGFFNISYVYTSESKYNSNESQPHMENKYNIEVFLNTLKVSNWKMCIDRKVFYPKRKTDKFSLSSIEETKAVTDFIWGQVKNKDETCVPEYKLSTTEIYTATEKQKAKMLESSEYENCKKQMSGFKYIPPTDDCFAAHEIISKYGNCEVYIDLSNISESHYHPDIAKIPTTEYGIHLLRVSELDNSHFSKMYLSHDILQFYVKETDFIKESIQSELSPFSTNPRSVAYDDYEIEGGISSACYITPNRLRTFTGNTIKNYHKKRGDESVAFIECVNGTNNGMTIQKYGDKHVGFELIFENNTLIASVEDNKLKLVYNEDVIEKTDNSLDDVKIYFLDTDVIYVSTKLVDLFYTTEYISVRIYSIYNNYLCGLCAETTNQ